MKKNIHNKRGIIVAIVMLIILMLGFFYNYVVEKNMISKSMLNDERKNLDSRKYYYSLKSLGDDVHKIYFRYDTSNYGWCMKKGANLYGFGSTEGYGHVKSESDAYQRNNAKSGYSGSIQWLLDNMYRIGTSVSDDEKGWYRNNLQRILGNTAKISNYTDDQIFKMEQFVLWQFTDNVYDVSLPNDPLCNALYNTAKNKTTYSSKKSKFSINTSKAKVNYSNGVVGPFTLSNNNVVNLTAKNNNQSIKIYKDESCTDELSKYNDYNKDVYVKVDDVKNVNIVFSYSAFNTSGHYYETEGNPGRYGDQPFLMITREKYEDSVKFEQSVEGNYHMVIKKRSTANLNTKVSADFTISQKKYGANTYTNTSVEIKNTDEQKTVSFNGKEIIDIDVNGCGPYKQDEYKIIENDVENGYQTVDLSGITIFVYKKNNGSELVVDYVRVNQNGQNIDTYVGNSNEISINGINYLNVSVSKNAVALLIKNKPIDGSYNMKIIKKMQ